MTWGDNPAELERWFTLTPADMTIVLGARGQPQRLERALMLTWMRAERTLASDVQTLPPPSSPLSLSNCISLLPS